MTETKKTESKTKSYELRYGNIYMPDASGKLVKHEVTRDADNNPGEPVKFEVDASRKDLIDILKDRKNVKAL